MRKQILLTGAKGRHTEMMPITVPIMSRYATRHDVDFQPLNLDSGDRPASWGKVTAMQAALARGYEQVLWIDIDVGIVEGRYSLFDQLVEGAWQQLSVHFTPEGPIPNAGVWLVTPAMTGYLDEIWQQDDLINHGWWEQAALLRLMGFDFSTRPVKFENPTELWRHTCVVGDEWNQHTSFFPSPRPEEMELPKALYPPPSPRPPEPYFYHRTMLGWPDRLKALREDAERSTA